MKRNHLSIAAAIFAAASIASGTGLAQSSGTTNKRENINPISAETVLTSQEASKALSFEKLDVNTSKISGVIANKTPHTIRDVQLMVQYHWLWRDEWNPGQDSPGRTVMIELNEQLEPGESHAFSYTPQFPLPTRNDGYFMPEVDVAGFTTVVRQRASAR